MAVKQQHGVSLKEAHEIFDQEEGVTRNATILSSSAQSAGAEGASAQ